MVLTKYQRESLAFPLLAYQQEDLTFWFAELKNSLF